AEAPQRVPPRAPTSTGHRSWQRRRTSATAPVPRGSGPTCRRSVTPPEVRRAHGRLGREATSWRAAATDASAVAPARPASEAGGATRRMLTASVPSTAAGTRKGTAADYSSALADVIGNRRQPDLEEGILVGVRAAAQGTRG